MAGGGSWQVEYRLQRGDGQVRWVREIGKALQVREGQKTALLVFGSLLNIAAKIAGASPIGNK